MTEEYDCNRENHRYRIALLLLVGLITLLLIPVLYKNYDSAFDLAAIFSGWITSIVGFYFLQQNTEKAQQQTVVATKNAAEARKEAMSAAKTQVNLLGANEFTLLLKNKKIKIYEGLYKEALTIINDLMEMQGGDD